MSRCRAKGIAAGMELLMATQPGSAAARRAVLEPRPWEPRAQACVSALAPRVGKATLLPRLVELWLLFCQHRGDDRQLFSISLLLWHLNQNLALLHAPSSPSSDAARPAEVPQWLRLALSMPTALLPGVSPCELCAGVLSPGPYVPITSLRKAPLHTGLFRRTSDCTMMLPALQLCTPTQRN